VHSAQHVFGREQVHGLLVVSNAVPSDEAAALAADPGYAITPAMVITWDLEHNEGALGRALVRLAG
jgi:hypothetical protein